jgi:hypothetical protein
MNIVLIERDIKDREQALQTCKYSLSYLKREGSRKYADAIRALSQEAFFLEDQLHRYRILFNILREDQKKFDEVPKRI